MFIGLAIAMVSVTAWSLPLGTETRIELFASGGTAMNLGTNYVIVPSQSANGGTPVVTYLAIRAFSGASINSTFAAYYSTNQTVITLTNTTGLERTNIVASTNGFAPGQLVVWQHNGQNALALRNQYEMLKVSTIQNTNQIVFDTAPVNPCQVGDTINQETVGPTIVPTSLTSTATTFTGEGIVSGQPGEPLLLLLSSAGLGTNTIDAVNVKFVPKTSP